ncbi:MAG: phycobilisome protein [Oscillatoriales cyanobacterium]|uniref:Phycobilisome protein n=1 Tax=Microcoleus anatoxicus PTRS2 TaxID=2705321 RepID=A0ABU8YQ76_9CYAN|nr:MAG: phycobilisome protein [Oscillatoriales cyanobacterium]TAD96456.1 MAG: phycobilisome protein [Oscillatoriales cyanobacterium]TAE04247.1 MAG: phycobilisome protein [Oscillatoriales cyanobacterium]TAF01930.1 MAG: phycobilisome protein [Oscillatoriales cyanobacterium]TAF32858.1 MAG: phycobilisome protein [Oscillatoriales cyanobacterium]
MLSQLSRLSVEADGRYASAAELQFLKDYFQSLNHRMSAYKKIQASEKEILSQVEAQMQSIDPNIFRRGSQDVTAKCRLDAAMVLRHSAAALLINDTERLRDRLLLWLQTILGPFHAKNSSSVTYDVMKKVIKQHLTTEEANLFVPILDINRSILGK